MEVLFTKNLFYVIVGCTFLLSGSIGLAIENLSESILLINESSYNSTLLYYLFASFVPIGIIFIIGGFFKK